MLVQSVDAIGKSKHPVFAELQEKLRITRDDRLLDNAAHVAADEDW